MDWRSRPTVNAGPLAAMTITHTSSSSDSSSISRGRSCQNGGPMALRRSGLSSHNVATWPSRVTEKTSDGIGITWDRMRVLRSAAPVDGSPSHSAPLGRPQDKAIALPYGKDENAASGDEDRRDAAGVCGTEH